MNKQDLLNFCTFCIKHKSKYGVLPTDFESKSGNIYGPEECWAASAKLGLDK
jgi:hypothetical protein